MSRAGLGIALVWTALACSAAGGRARIPAAGDEPPDESPPAPAPSGARGGADAASPGDGRREDAGAGEGLLPGPGAAPDGGPDATVPDVARAPDGAAPPATSYVYVGSGFYSAGGLHAFRLDPHSGTLTEVDRHRPIQSPTFLAVHPDRRVLYVSLELDSSLVLAYAIDPATGKLRKLNERATGGRGSTYVAVHPAGRHLFVANYEGRSAMVLGIEEDGSVGRVLDTRSTPHPNPHCINPDPAGRFVFVPNRGVPGGAGSISQLVLQAGGKLADNTPPAVPVPDGTGPRHIGFHPSRRFAYVDGETNSTLIAYAYDEAAGTLREIHRASTLPAGFSGRNSPADLRVHPSGRFVYVVNRGHDSLAIFRVDPATGRVTPAGHQPTGAAARNIAVDETGTWLVAGVIGGGRVVVYRVDATSGRLTQTDEKAVPTPAGVAIATVR